ncbi:hypothetical protein [Azospirillum halopraeferens]|uniref:hypothetical protein n=1 Tax=Azospirillum halopraeferens TaxID=34010 RepID=UPI00048BF089|nr:hypothetical protein [Azospirillum halopraeferens]
MTDKPEDRVAAIVEAAGGRLVSRVRLQKIAYLIDQVAEPSGFEYSYHHYGPYSRDLDNAVLDAEAFGKVKESVGYRHSDGARYSIFELKECGEASLAKKAKDLIPTLAATNVTVLELAATAHWLATAERIEDWENEIRRRKGSKTEGGRLDEAKKLLANIGLPPAERTA